MYQGNWKCSSCGGTITELPFEPKSEKGLTCRSCFMQQKDEAKTTTPDAATAAAADEQTDAPPFDPADAAGAETAPTPPEFSEAAAPTNEKPKHTGEWTCSVCGGPITSLPFEPRSTENLKCIDCFKKSKS